jgi:hypothetical protein
MTRCDQRNYCVQSHGGAHRQPEALLPPMSAQRRGPGGPGRFPLDFVRHAIANCHETRHLARQGAPLAAISRSPGPARPFIGAALGAIDALETESQPTMD